MSNKPTPAFVELLKRVMADYGKPLPDASVILAWWNALAPFKPEALRQAFSDYALERPDFPPVPNSIAARCRLLERLEPHENKGSNECEGGGHADLAGFSEPYRASGCFAR